MRELKQRIGHLIKKLGSTGFGHLFGSSVINKIMTLMSSVILVRLIPKSDYGVYSNANNILSMFCLLEGAGMTTTMLQYGCTTSGEKKEKIWSFCFYFSVVFQVILCIAIALTGKYASFGIEGTGEILVALSFLPLVRLISEMQRIYLRTELKNKEYAYANTFSTAATVVLSVVLSVFFFVYGIISANYLACILTILFISFSLNTKLPKPDFGLSKSEKRELFKFSAVATVNNSTASIMYLLDTFILGIVVAQSTVTASYKVASTIPTALSFIPTCVMTYIYPYFARHSEDGKWCMKNYKKVLLLFGMFNFIMVGTLIFAAPLVIKILFGSQYMDAVAIFRILCLNYMLHSTFRTIPGQLLVTQKKLSYNTFVGFASGALNTLLNLVLIPRYSSVGAALATLIVTSVFAVMSTIYLFNVYKKLVGKEIKGVAK